MPSHLTGERLRPPHSAAWSRSGTFVRDRGSGRRSTRAAQTVPWSTSTSATDGARLATASSLGVRFWDATTGASLGRIGKRAPAHDIDFSADGRMLAFARGWKGGAEVWDAATRTSTATVDSLPYTPDWTVALSPDGRTLALGGWGTAVRVVDVRTGKLVHQLDLAGTGAFALEFSPDGRILAVSGFENVASLWDVATGTQIGPRLTAGSRRTMLDLSPDGRRLLVTTGNGEGAVWDIDPESWARRACALANRTLTREEWEEFLPGRPYEPACAPESDSGRIDQVKLVREAGGARPPGRRPRRTSSVGGAASLASLRRAGPRPSRCHLVDSPTTRSSRRGSPRACPPRPAESAAARPRCRGRAGRRARRARGDGSRRACPAPAPRRRRRVGAARGGRARAMRRARPPPSRARPHRRGRGPGPPAPRPEERAGPRRTASPRGRP